LLLIVLRFPFKILFAKVGKGLWWVAASSDISSTTKYHCLIHENFDFDEKEMKQTSKEVKLILSETKFNVAPKKSVRLIKIFFI
jgi:hypothetical protein